MPLRASVGSRLSSPYIASPRFLPLPSRRILSPLCPSFPFLVRTPVTVGGGPSRPQHDLALANDDMRHPIHRYGRICRVWELRLQHSSRGGGAGTRAACKSPSFSSLFHGVLLWVLRRYPTATPRHPCHQLAPPGAGNALFVWPLAAPSHLSVSSPRSPCQRAVS